MPELNKYPENKSFFFTRKKEVYRLDVKPDGFSVWVSTPKGNLKSPKSWRWIIDCSTLFNYEKSSLISELGELGINTKNEDMPYFRKIGSNQFRLNDRKHK